MQYHHILHIESYCGHAWMARTLFHLHRPKEAIVLYKIALRIQPDDNTLWAELGRVYSSINDIYHSIQCYREAIHVSKGKFPFYLEYGQLLLRFIEEKSNIRSDSITYSGNTGVQNTMLNSYNIEELLQDAYVTLVQAVKYCNGCDDAWFMLGTYSRFQQYNCILCLRIRICNFTL